MYHSLLALKRFKSPWKAENEWWKAWQRLMSNKLPRFLPGLPSSDTQKSEIVCDTMYQFYRWRLNMAKITLPEDREFNQWKAEKRPSPEAAKEEKKAWNEPSPNWSEFELFLRYGRRWKKHWEAWKKKKAKTNSTTELGRPDVDSINTATSGQAPLDLGSGMKPNSYKRVNVVSNKGSYAEHNPPEVDLVNHGNTNYQRTEVYQAKIHQTDDSAWCTSSIPVGAEGPQPYTSHATRLINKPAD
jgi:hypothetical protein